MPINSFRFDSGYPHEFNQDNMPSISEKAATLIRIMERSCHERYDLWKERGDGDAPYRRYMIIRSMRLMGCSARLIGATLGVTTETVTRADKWFYSFTLGFEPSHLHQLYEKYVQVASIECEWLPKDEAIFDGYGWMVIHLGKDKVWRGDGVVYKTHAEALASKFINDGLARIIRVSWQK